MHLGGSGPCQVLFGHTTVVSHVSNVLAILVSYFMLVQSLKFCNYCQNCGLLFLKLSCMFDASLMHVISIVTDCILQVAGNRMLEIYLLGILTGLLVTLLAIYCQLKIMGHSNSREEDPGLTATIIREQSWLLGEALHRRR